MDLNLGAFPVGKPRTDYPLQTLEMLDSRPEFGIDPWDFLDREVREQLTLVAVMQFRKLAANQKPGFVWDDVRWLYVPNGKGEGCAAPLDHDRFEWRQRELYAENRGKEPPSEPIPGYIDVDFLVLISELGKVPRFLSVWLDGFESGVLSDEVGFSLYVDWLSVSKWNKYADKYVPA